MKKHFLIAALLLCSLSLFAQEGSQNIGLYIGSANPILREQSSKIDTTLSHATKMPGFNVGLVYETTFIKGFGLQMGLNYTLGYQSGKWQSSSSSTINKTRDSYMLHQIKIPVEWQYKFCIAKQTYLLLYTGPTIEATLGYSRNRQIQNINPSTQKMETTSAITNMFTLDSDGDDKADYSRLNITWGVGGGFQYKRYFLRGGYDFGIMSPYKDRFHNTLDWYPKGRLDQWSIKLGMYLWQF